MAPSIPLSAGRQRHLRAKGLHRRHPLGGQSYRASPTQFQIHFTAAIMPGAIPVLPLVGSMMRTHGLQFAALFRSFDHELRRPIA